MLSNEELQTLITDWSEKISTQLENIETSESAEELCKWIQRTGGNDFPEIDKNHGSIQ